MLALAGSGALAGVVGRGGPGSRRGLGDHEGWLVIAVTVLIGWMVGVAGL